MTILLQWLVEHAWAFYAACAIGFIIYMMRALAAQRERRLALFTLERETANARIIKAWTMAFVFVAIGAAIFASTTFILPGLSIYNPETSLPTPTLSAGVETPTPGITPTPSPTLGSLVLTSIPTATGAPVSTSPPPAPTEPPTLAPTDTPATAISGQVGVRFGDFAELSSYSLPAAEFATSQPLPLTLYWQALERTSAMNYIVFTHLVSEDGRLIAQHDGAPASGTRPTTNWGPSEIIADPHPMAFQDTTYVGPANIWVGLYDPGTGRALAETGSDHVILPIKISIVPQ
jgi:hypothetical protein